MKNLFCFVAILSVQLSNSFAQEVKKSVVINGKKGINGVVIITTKAKKAESTDHIDFVKLNPLFIVDDVELKEGTSLSSIDPKDISLIQVLKSKVDIEPYGEKGKNCVVIITTKNFKK
jgi:hypothetical protein